MARAVNLFAYLISISIPPLVNFQQRYGQDIGAITLKSGQK